MKDNTLSLKTKADQCNYTDLKIRKLTPKECWRLMGFDDYDFEKAEKVNSNTQLYKQAGNSIVVNVLEEILKNLNLKNDVKILELFGGIGACSKALKRIGKSVTIVDYVEIDKYAVKSFNAINNTNFEPQDITTWEKNIVVDLVMHGSPCQDFSLAGKQAGGDEGSGTRSSLMYETIRIVKKLKPKYVIWENVKNILSKKHKHNFESYLNAMEELGYTNYYQVLNAKDYGIPQNRERVFTISILNDDSFEFPLKSNDKNDILKLIENEVDEKYYVTDSNFKTYQRDFGSKGKEIDLDKPIPTLTASMGTGGGNIPYFKFPSKKELKLRLKEMLDDNVDEKYYLSEKAIHGRMITHYQKYKLEENCINNKEIHPTILARFEGAPTLYKETIQITNATKKGYLEAEDGDGINISSRMKYQRGNVQKQSIQTITTNGGNDRGVVLNETIY